MKKQDLLSLGYQLASPVLLMVLGAVLIVNPDSASALIARIIGWLVMLVGIGFVIAAVFSRQKAGKIIGAVVCFGLSGWLLANPLLLAAGIGRVLGIVIAARGARDVLLAERYHENLILPVVTAVIGAVLIFLPLTTSRLVFSICGGVILCIGAAMAADRLKRHRYLEPGDSNIIDAL